MAIKDYSTEPDMNTTISGINIAEGCAPSGINNAIRQLMADVKEEKDKRDAAQSAKDAAQDAAITAAQSSADAAQSSADAAQSSADAAQSSADALVDLLIGKADVGFGNVTEKGKASAVSWVMPDYNSIITLTVPSTAERSWTASTDGFVLCCLYGCNGANGALIINGLDVLRVNTGSNQFAVCGTGTFPVSKGNVIKYKAAGLDTMHYNSWVAFTPAKGA